ncbi:hypothetical protein FACS1894113_4190 [Alphaproteobacteria bacterium]|nr:hypothetical protein FACS1894113_4190 [Alphaproteobacteria bacterium]
MRIEKEPKDVEILEMDVIYTYIQKKRKQKQNIDCRLQKHCWYSQSSYCFNKNLFIAERKTLLFGVVLVSCYNIE